MKTKAGNEIVGYFVREHHVRERGDYLRFIDDDPCWGGREPARRWAAKAPAKANAEKWARKFNSRVVPIVRKSPVVCPVKDCCYLPEETFKCKGCKQTVCWCAGAEDGHPELCDDCANKAEAKSEKRDVTLGDLIQAGFEVGLTTAKNAPPQTAEEAEDRVLQYVDREIISEVREALAPPPGWRLTEWAKHVAKQRLEYAEDICQANAAVGDCVGSETLADRIKKALARAEKERDNARNSADLLAATVNAANHELPLLTGSALTLAERIKSVVGTSGDSEVVRLRAKLQSYGGILGRIRVAFAIPDGTPVADWIEAQIKEAKVPDFRWASKSSSEKNAIMALDQVRSILGCSDSENIVEVAKERSKTENGSWLGVRLRDAFNIPPGDSVLRWLEDLAKQRKEPNPEVERLTREFNAFATIKADLVKDVNEWRKVAMKRGLAMGKAKAALESDQ